MEEQQEHRGFLITVSTRDDRAGGSTVTLLVEQLPRDGEHDRGAVPLPEPEHYRSLYTGTAAVGEAVERARRAIDAELGDPDPFEN